MYTRICLVAVGTAAIMNINQVFGALSDAPESVRQVAYCTAGSECSTSRLTPLHQDAFTGRWIRHSTKTDTALSDQIPEGKLRKLQDYVEYSYPQQRKKKPNPPAAAPVLTAVPGQLDNLYRYNVNSISDLVTYRAPNGSLQQLFTYWNQERRLQVVRRAFPDGEFIESEDVNDSVLQQGESLRYDSHNTTAIGVASNGVMFVTGNHHVSELNMAKTTTAFDLTSFAPMLPEDMVAGSEVNRVTYPSFFTHNNLLYFSYRELDSGQGAPRFRWLINRYNPSTDNWETAVQLNTGIALRMYVSPVAVPARDNGMHLFAIWRDDAAGGGVDNQKDYMHLYSEDGTTWRIKNSNTTITVANPLWLDNGDATILGYTGTVLEPSEKIWSTPPDPIPRSAGASAVDQAGNPHSLTKAYDGTLFHHQWQAKRFKRWKSTALSGWEAQSYEIFSCSDTTGALLSNGDEITFRSLDPQDFSFNNPVLLAKGYTTSDYSISIDKEAIKHDYVSFVLTENTHYAPGQHTTESNVQPAWVATYPCDQIATSDPFIRDVQ